MKYINLIIIAIILCLIVGCASKTCVRSLNQVEPVMTPGMKITATTPVGLISITAGEGFVRSYTWEGATRSVEMSPRAERWYGSLGLYYPGPGEHWKEHDGITRGVVEEGQQHFQTVDEAMKWIQSRNYMPYVYTDNGLIVGWRKVSHRKQLNVEVWQIFISGRKPNHLPGSQNNMIIVSVDQDKDAPIVQAVNKNDLQNLKTLLAKGDNPNTTDSLGNPILILATKKGYQNAVQLLVSKGANVDAVDETNDGNTALSHAIEANYTEIAKYLIQKGADVNARCKRGLNAGATPLMSAVEAGNTTMVRFLLEREADVNTKDESGLTAVDFANKHSEIFNLLKKAGAKHGNLNYFRY